MHSAAFPVGRRSSVAKACRWVSLPGETCRIGGLDLDETAAGEPVPATPPDARRAPPRTAAGRHKRAGSHQGEGGHRVLHRAF